MSPSPLGAFYRSPLGAFYRSPLGARGGPEGDTWRIEFEGLPTFEVCYTNAAGGNVVVADEFTAEEAIWTRGGVEFFLRSALRGTGTTRGGASYSAVRHHAIDASGFTELSLDDLYDVHPGWSYRDGYTSLDATGVEIHMKITGSEAAQVPANPFTVPMNNNWTSSEGTIATVADGATQTLRGIAGLSIKSTGTPNSLMWLIDFGSAKVITNSSDAARPWTRIRKKTGTTFNTLISANV